LPFYVNGTAPAATLATLERELESNAALQDELREVRSLRDALAGIDAALPSPPASLYDDVLAKIGTSVSAPRPASISWLRSKSAGAWGVGLGVAACAALFFAHPEARIEQFASPPAADVALKGSFAAGAAGALAPAAPPPAPEPMVEERSTQAVVHAKVADADERSATTRQLARTGAIGLIVPDVSSALAKIQSLTQEQFGAVTALQDDAPSTPGEKHTAQATVSVPDDRFVRTLDALAALGGVTSRSVSTEDLTDSIVDTAARLRNLRHEEADLLRIMDRSGKIEDVLDVEQQLASTRQSIEELDAQGKAMQRRVAYATITIDLSDEKTVPVAAPGAASQVGDAWRLAVHRAGAFTLWVVAQAFMLIVFLPYLAVAALGAYLIARRLRPRG
jgi:hypothetical protein